MSEGARHGEPACLHGLENSHALREEGTMMTLPADVFVGRGLHRMPDPLSSGPPVSAP